MFRMRRYRAFLIVAALSAATLYYLVNVRHATLSDVDRFRYFKFGSGSQDSTKDHAQLEHKSDSPPEPNYPSPPDPEIELPPGPTTTLRRVAHTKIEDYSEPTPTLSKPRIGQETTGEELLVKQPIEEVDLKEINGGQWRSPFPPSDAPRSRWQQQSEHNPVPDDEVIRLPKGNPLALPKVQHAFTPEKGSEKTERLRKLVAIREAFKHAWQGYEKYAMPHDELWPITKSYGDSFMGWGATLIDSLDTLWIMDMKDEFVRAVNETMKVDFKTSHKKEIPMFETVIRILGGLLSAYDLSGEQYPDLLEKAVELADILMGAFDTPNRMPDMYYKWAPSYASQHHRSGTRVVVAEIGTLSLEFTRLAQLTKNNRYYDAIARIQNALEDWQMGTEMPGLWPLNLDASGCKKLDQVKVQSGTAENNEKPVLLDSDQINEGDLLEGETPADIPVKGTKSSGTHKKRQADDNYLLSRPLGGGGKDMFDLSGVKEPTGNSVLITKDPDEDPDEPFCRSQGLNYEPYAKMHVYGIAAKGDSTYEYMPKMYRLLGGLGTQYQSMYKNSAKMIREKVLYRAMIQDSTRKVLFPAQYEYDTSNRIATRRVKVTYEASHLGCFAGGMFGLAAKTFGISSDLDIAKELTDGCVWAYESTPTGIMPEDFELTPCESTEVCPWDEDRWHKALDPHLKERLDAVHAWNKEQRKIFQQTGMHIVKGSAPEAQPVPVAKPQPTVFKGTIVKEFDRKESGRVVKRDPPVAEHPTAVSPEVDEEDGPLLGFIPKITISHEKYVKARILEERLPPSYTKIASRNYILRPEAIESVFIMWRITGEEYWRRKGWNMFQAIQEATHTEAGNAELADVTSILGEKLDKMESFWLGETLKYFYLLFSEPSVVSLDDYVFNTEAHPFRTPRP